MKGSYFSNFSVKDKKENIFCFHCFLHKNQSVSIRSFDIESALSMLMKGKTSNSWSECKLLTGNVSYTDRRSIFINIITVSPCYCVNVMNADTWDDWDTMAASSWGGSCVCLAPFPLTKSTPSGISIINGEWCSSGGRGGGGGCRVGEAVGEEAGARLPAVCRPAIRWRAL